MRSELSAVAVLVLALLHEQPMHPYQVHQVLLRRGDTRLVRINAGAVYHAVERLARDGFVQVVGTDREGRRPERTTYEVTSGGRAAFADRVGRLLEDDLPSYPLFDVGLAECHELPETDVAAALAHRRERTARELADLQTRHRSVLDRGVPAHYLLDLDHAIAHLHTEVDWLDRTLQALAADPLAPGALDWDARPPAHLARTARTLDDDGDALTPTEQPR